ncbi:MAG: type II toxin-antitoxin system death-on-curing family toxin [Rhodothermales bacterium]
MVDVFQIDLIRQHGGSPRVRDGGLIDSALARPLNRFAYEADADLIDLAASYAVGLAKNHGYIDGNKRVAFMAMYVFLRINGIRLVAPEPDAVRVMLDVATGALDERTLAAWLRENVD